MFSCKAGYDRFPSVDCNESFPRASFKVTWKPVAPSGNVHTPKSHFGHSQLSDLDLDDIFKSDSFGVSKRKVITLDCDLFVGYFDVFVLEKQSLFAHFALWFFKIYKLNNSLRFKAKDIRERKLKKFLFEKEI